MESQIFTRPLYFSAKIVRKLLDSLTSRRRGLYLRHTFHSRFVLPERPLNRSAWLSPDIVNVKKNGRGVTRCASRIFTLLEV